MTFASAYPSPAAPTTRRVRSCGWLRAWPAQSALVAYVKVAGELDFDSAPLLTDVVGHVIRRPVFRYRRKLVVDLAKLSFCDAAGATALLAIRDRVRSAGGELTLRNPSPITLKVLRLSGTRDAFDIRVIEQPRVVAAVCAEAGLASGDEGRTQVT
jgi:anti-sigma B factor antagonist